jgi:uridine monophosphate synthetase
MLDDLISSGDSKLEAIKPLQQAGLEVNDVVVLIDREGGGREELEARGLTVHSVFKLRDLLDILVQYQRITIEQRSQVENFLQAQTA